MSGSMLSALVFVATALAAVAARGALRARRSARARRRLGARDRPTRSPAPLAPLPFADALEAAGYGAADAGRVWQGWTVGGAGLVAVVGIGLGPLTAAVAVVLVSVVPVGVLWSLRDRGASVYELLLPGVLDDVASGLRSGSSLVGALGAASVRAPVELAPDIAAVVDAVERGGSLEEELDRWARRRPLPGVQLAAAALAVGASTGGRQARAVETVGATLRDRAAVRREAAGLATQSRASALVMSVIPLVFAVAAATLDPRVGHVLVRTPIGLSCLVGGLALDGVAGLWMARITRGAR